MTDSNYSEGFFQSHDGLDLFYRFHSVPNAKNTLVILHGHGEHSGRYQKFYSILKEKQLNIAHYDFRGHGRSEGRHVYVDDYNQFIEDVSAFVHFLRQKKWMNQERFILLGHSNGGLTAVHWAMSHSAELKGLILSSPFLGIKLPWFLKLLNRTIEAVQPKFVYKNPVYPPYLTHNKDEVELYKKDRYIRRKITARLLSQMILYIHKLPEPEQVRWSFPFYILMSAEERVVDPEATEGFYEKVNVPKKDLTKFKGMYHEIFNELGQEQVFEKLNNYLDQIINEKVN